MPGTETEVCMAGEPSLNGGAEGEGPGLKAGWGRRSRGRRTLAKAGWGARKTGNTRKTRERAEEGEPRAENLGEGELGNQENWENWEY